MSTPTFDPTQNPKAQAKAAKAYAKATRPWYKKKRWWLVIVVALAIIAGLAGGGEAEDGGPKKVDSAASATDADSKKPGSKSNPIKVGETVELEGTRYTVKSAETSGTVGSEFFEEKADGVFVVVELTIENKKDETKTFMSNAATFVGGNDKKYSTDDDGSIAAENSLMLEDMQPDVPKTGTLVYDVPQGAVRGGVLEVADLFGNGEAYIALGLK